MSLLDDLDIAILSFVSDFPNSTITSCAKELYNPQETEVLQKKDTMLRHRYKALVQVLNIIVIYLMAITHLMLELLI